MDGRINSCSVNSLFYIISCIETVFILIRSYIPVITSLHGSSAIGSIDAGAVVNHEEAVPATETNRRRSCHRVVCNIEIDRRIAIKLVGRGC